MKKPGQAPVTTCKIVQRCSPYNLTEKDATYV